MTSPILPVDVRCPKCEQVFEAYYRASINTHIEKWTEEQIDRATSAVCPHCHHKVYFDALVVAEDGTFEFREGESDEDEDDEE